MKTVLTPQEVQDKKFAKAVFGGYDMGEVDEFLDQIVSDYEQLYKENAILKGKLKTLAEKVEEYRSVDEQMRQTLARAKRESDEQIESAKQQSAEMRTEADEYSRTVRADADEYSEKLLTEARSEAETLLAGARRSSEEMQTIARNEAMMKLTDIRKEIEAEERRLAEARNETKQLAAEVAEVCKHQLEALRAIVAVPAPTHTAVEEPARAAFAEQSIDVPNVGGSSPDDEPTVRIEAERITERQAADTPATVADAANDEDFEPVEDEVPAIDFDNEPTIRFDKPRRVDIGGDTVEFDDPEDEQSDDDAFRQIFGRGKDGE